MVIHSLYAYILKGNAFGKGEKNAEKMRKLRWKEELIHMMDADGDGEVQPDEVLEFLTNHEKLKNDPTIQRCIGQARGKSTTALLKELKYVFPKIIAVLVADDTTDITSSGTNHTRNTFDCGGTPFTKHMQLQDFYQDPEGIKVRARKGVGAMECLVANDPGGLAANLGAALLLPITDVLREVGYTEGYNFRGYGYDWRVPVTKLEHRDQFLSQTMLDMEDLYTTNNNERIVVVTHSLGGVTASYFFQWVAHSQYGQDRGGIQWLKKHIQAFLPIAGPLLGTPYGSVCYLSGDAMMGLSPMVFSHTDQHIVVRSWGMFGEIFPTGKHLMLNPTKSVHWVRKEGMLNLHLLDVEVTEQDELTESQKSKNKQYYVTVDFTTPVTKITDSLRSTPFKMSTASAIDEHMQFSWTKEPQSIDGATLKVTMWRDLVGPFDKRVEQGTFIIGTDSVTPIGNHGDNSSMEGLKPNEWVKYTFDLDEKTESDTDDVKVTVKLQFIPYSDTELYNDFRRKDDPVTGAYRCGGPSDVCTSNAKKIRLKQALGPIEGKEWSPKSGTGKFKDHRDAEYAPMSVDQMMVLDHMEKEYKGWKHCFMDDLIWRQYSTEPPQGIDYQRKTKLFTRLQPTSTLQLDTSCDVDHPGFKAKGGIVYEVPHKTPQADDPTVPLDQMTYNTRASGDGTVCYWSMRWPVTWQKQGFTVNPVEVEGADHRNIVGNPVCLEAILGECCYKPIKYLEVWIDTVSYGRMEKCVEKLPCCLRCLLFPITCILWCVLCIPMCLFKCAGIGQERIFVDLAWRKKSYGTETILTPCRGYKVENKRFVLGVTQLDLDNDAEIEFCIKYPIVKQVSSGTMLSGTQPVTFKLSQLVNKNPSKPELINSFDEQGRHTVTWHWRWLSAD